MAKAFISDAEMEQLEASNAPKKRFISDEDMMKLESVSRRNYDAPVETGVKTALDEFLLGNYPQAAAGIESVYSDEPYVSLRDKKIQELKKLQEENPTASKVGTGAGLIAGLAVPVGAAAKGAGLLAKVGRAGAVGAIYGGLRNPGDSEGVVDPVQAEQRLKGAEFGGGAGLLLGGLGAGAGKLAESEPVQKGLEKLKNYGAIKQAGGMLKDFRQLMSRNQMGEVADTLLNEDVATKNGTEKLLKFGDKVDAIAAKSKSLRDKVGEEIGAIYNQIDDRLTDQSFISNLPSEKIEKLSKAKRFDPSVDVEEINSILKSKYQKSIGGAQAIERAQDILSDLQKKGNTLSESLASKGEIDSLINYSKRTQDMPIYQQVLKDIRNYIKDKTNTYVKDVADVVGLKESQNLEKANKLYGNLSTIQKMAADRVTRLEGQNALGLTDLIAGGAGAAGFGPAGLLAAGASKVARERGPGMLAIGSRALGNGLLKAKDIPLDKLSRIPPYLRRNENGR